MSLKLSGVNLGNITGGPSSINLFDLADVSIVAPLTGQYLRYNSVISEWQNSYINTEVFGFLNTNLTGSNGVVLTNVSGPQTVDIGLSITASSDATGSLTAGNLALTLATVNSNVGSFGSATTIPVITVNAKGLITAISQTAFAGTASLATSLAGGATGDLPYQSSPNNTSFLSAGTASQVLIGGPAAPSWSNTPALTGTNFTGIPNTSLTNSSITIGSTSISLGATATALAGLASVTSTSFVGSLTGSATTLATGRTFSLSTDATGTSGLFDGSNNVTIPMTLATVNAAPQTDAFRRATVNAKGLVTGTSPVVAGDITAALGFTPVNRAGDTMTGNLILNADPTVALGAVTKQYADMIALGLQVHAACVTSTTETLAISSAGTVTYNNGAGGVGATLTTTGSFATIGGYAPADGSRILVKDEVVQANNGIYVKTSSTVLTRADDFDNSPMGEITAGDFTFVVFGTIGGTSWVQTTYGTIIIGTTAIVFTQMSGPGVYVSGVGIDITSNVISNIGVTSAIAGSNISVSSATGAVTIAVVGTVPSATTLAVGRTFSLSTDATGTSGLFDGSSNVTIPMTLATVNSSPQTDTFRKVTVNAKGLVTATSAVSSSDLTTALGYTPVNRAGDSMTGALTISRGVLTEEPWMNVVGDSAATSPNIWISRVGGPSPQIILAAVGVAGRFVSDSAVGSAVLRVESAPLQISTSAGARSEVIVRPSGDVVLVQQPAGSLGLVIDSPAGNPGMVFRDRSVNAAAHDIGTILFDAYRDVSNPSYVAAIRCSATAPIGNTGDLIFSTGQNATNSLPPERMRINYEGTVTVSSPTGSQAALYVTTSITPFTGGLVISDNVNYTLRLARGAGTNVGTIGASAGSSLSLTSNNVERMFITQDGRFYGNALHNNPGPVTGTTNQYIASGTYTPTFSNGINVTSTQALQCQWTRIGNVVHVSGAFQLDPFSSSVLTAFDISLPIAVGSNFPSSALAGIATRDPNTENLTGCIRPQSNVAQFAVFQDIWGANATWYFNFSYQVI